MKKFILSAMIALSALCASAQQTKESVNQKFFETKIKEFVYRLDLSDQQKAQFIPVYQRYSNELHVAMRENGKAFKHGKDKKAAISKEEAAAIEKAKIKSQMAAQEIRLKYVDEFAAILEPDQMGKLFYVESQIQRELMHRKHEHYGKPRI